MSDDPQPKESLEKASAQEAADQSSPEEKSTSQAVKIQENQSGDSTTAVFNGEIEIHLNRGIPHLDKGPVKAYVAQPVKHKGAPPYFAMICARTLSPRMRRGGTYASILSPGLPKLVASGPIYLPISDTWSYCLIYENTLGKPLMGAKDAGLGMRPEHLMKTVIHPLYLTMLDLRDADIIHGEIHPSNLFDGGSENFEKVMLGECLSGPVGFNCPAVYLPVERAMADPIGRGRGTFANDLYALGVTLITLMRHKNPLAGLSQDEIIKEKMEKGSYAALTGHERFTGAILELLRGLLFDDEAQRWTLEDFGAWLDGQRLSPKQSSKKKQAARPLIFNDKKYFRRELLARDLFRKQAEAVQLIDNGHLEHWITRSLQDNNVFELYEQALETAQEQGRGAGYWDRLLSRVSISLDPKAPLRYKNLQVHADGVGKKLTETVVNGGDLQPFAEIIQQQLVFFWLSAAQDTNIDIGLVSSNFDNCRAFLRQKNMGYGIERCLYVLNPEAPCLSPKLSRYYVRNPEDLMHALEDMADRSDRPHLFIDRHIAAFLSVKDRNVIDGYWQELNAEDEYLKVMGNIKVVATIQKRARMGGFPKLSAWAVEMLAPVYSRYHDRDLRNRLRQKAAEVQAKGDLTRIAGIFDNEQTVLKDFDNFKKAMAEYDSLRNEYDDLIVRLEKPEIFGKKTGREVAAIVSCILASLIILGVAFMSFTGGG